MIVLKEILLFILIYDQQLFKEDNCGYKHDRRNNITVDSESRVWCNACYRIHNQVNVVNLKRNKIRS
jgi:hypothetical protein